MGNENKKGPGHTLGGPSAAPPQPQKPGAQRSSQQKPPQAQSRAPTNQSTTPTSRGRHYGGGVSMAQAGSSQPKPKPAAAAPITRTRSQENKWQTIQAGLTRMEAAEPAAQQAALSMLDKLVSNVLKNPGEAKYRTVWLSNAKVGKCLRAADGAVMVLEGSGFEAGSTPDTLEYNNGGDSSNNFLYRAHDAVKSRLYDVVGRPNAFGEIGSTATVGKILTAQGQIGDDKELAARLAASGGVCAVKYGGALETEEFTMEHCQRVQDSFEHLKQCNGIGVCQQLLGQLKQALEEIMSDPESQALRQMPLPPEVAAVEGAHGLATAIGFECTLLDGQEELLLCPLGVPVIRSVLDQMTQFQTVLAQLKAAEADGVCTQVAPVQIPDRETQVLQFQSAGSAALVHVPDSFFELRPGDLQHTQRSGKAHRVKSRKYNKCLVRVQLPNNTVLQAVFNPSEKVSALQEFITSTLAEPFRPFSLSLGTQEIQMQRSLWDSGLVPSALLHFRWLPMDGLEPSTAMLTPELTAQTVQMN